MNANDHTHGARDKANLDALLADAIDRKNRNDFSGALRALRTITRKYPASPSAYLLLGGIYLSMLKQPKKALPFFQKLIDLAPKSEKGSLGLFHSLWQTDQEHEALEEMKRFQSISHCRDYDEILTELLETTG